MKSAQILRQKINSPEVTTGVIITFHLWPGLIEILMKAGMDYAIIDLEHLTPSHEMVAECCAIGRRADFPILIRPPEAEFTPMRLAMDLGPCGMLVPYVSKVETMDLIREAVYMAPRGRRRPGGLGNFWVNDDYNYESFRSKVEDDVIIMPQIENLEGLANAEAIAAHPLTTALAIGPYDMSASLGCCWEPDNEKLTNALKTVREAGRSQGKNTWIIGDHTKMRGLGFNFLGISEPIMCMESALRSLNEKVKSGQASEGKPELLP